MVQGNGAPITYLASPNMSLRRKKPASFMLRSQRTAASAPLLNRPLHFLQGVWESLQYVSECRFTCVPSSTSCLTTVALSLPAEQLQVGAILTAGVRKSMRVGFSPHHPLFPKAGNASIVIKQVTRRPNQAQFPFLGCKDTIANLKGSPTQPVTFSDYFSLKC